MYIKHIKVFIQGLDPGRVPGPATRNGQSAVPGPVPRRDGAVPSGTSVPSDGGGDRDRRAGGDATPAPAVAAAVAATATTAWRRSSRCRTRRPVPPVQLLRQR